MQHLLTRCGTATACGVEGVVVRPTHRGFDVVTRCFVYRATPHLLGVTCKYCLGTAAKGGKGGKGRSRRRSPTSLTMMVGRKASVRASRLLERSLARPSTALREFAHWCYVLAALEDGVRPQRIRRRPDGVAVTDHWGEFADAAD